MKKLIAVSLVSAAALGAMAQTATNTVLTRPMSLKDCIAAALQHNFDIQIQRYDPIIQQAALSGAYGGYDPLLNISGSHNHNEQGAYFTPLTTSDNNSFNSDIGSTTPWGLQYDFLGNLNEHNGGNFSDSTFSKGDSDYSYGTVGVNLTQPLLKNFWIDSTRLTIEVAKNRLQYSEQTLRQQFITTVAAVQNAYYELIYAQENVQVTQEALNLAQTQLDQDRQRVQVGSLAPLDVQQDESQVATSKANLIAARMTLVTDENVLKNLVTDNFSQVHATDIQPTEPLTATLELFDLQDSWAKGMTKRPDLLQARLDVAQQGINLKFDKNQLYPELDLKGSYGYNGNGQEFSDALNQYYNANRPYYSYGAAISLPLSNTKARNTVKSDKATMQQKLLTLKQLEQTVLVQIDNAVEQVASDYQGVQASKQARIYAEAALDAEQRKYNVGKSTTFTVLQLQSTLTTNRGAEIRSIANYNEDLAKLAQLEGTTLEEQDINLQAK